MKKELLTSVVTTLVNKYADSQEYGVTLLNIPDFNYEEFANDINSKRSIELFLLGFDTKSQKEVADKLSPREGLTYSFSVEDAEASRNNGDEGIFRVLIIKRSEMEKISSLRWFPEIDLEKVYTTSCDYVKNNLGATNNVIESMIKALRSKAVRQLLSFERVLDYLDLILNSPEDKLPEIVRDNYYTLGLLSDKNVVSGNPNKDDYVLKIKRNHSLVERIGNLEQTERQSITNYYAKAKDSKGTPRKILSFYKTKELRLLKEMDISDVENCLKAAKTGPGPNPKPPKKKVYQPTSLGAQMVFDGDSDKIDALLDQMENDIDHRPNTKKTEKIDVDLDGTKLQVKVEPVTEKVASQLTSGDDLGGIIYADLDSPTEAIREVEKYSFEPFTKESLDEIKSDLSKIAALIADGESISDSLEQYLKARDVVAKYINRLQDAPMLQVLAKYSEFENYIRTYEKLLFDINEDFPKIWTIAASNAKAIINGVMSMDYIFIVGEKKMHAIPTPLHPMYLWKYVELAKEILAGKGVSSIEDGFLSESDKSFIIRKSEDIPDPLSVMLMPVTVTNSSASFLPIAGRIGMLPIYSNVPQVNQSESGIDTLKQSIVRYLCLYPHAGLMLRIGLIDPPSVEVVVAMLKALNSNSEFNIDGIELTIFRTKEVPESWIEIDDDSMNDGMLGKYKGKRSLNFKLKIVNKRLSYGNVLTEIANNQHIIAVFDPNEVRIETAQNSRYIHVHPLCIPKVYKYNPINEEVEIRPASEGSVFSTYSSIIERLNEHPSTFSHTSTFFRTPLKRDTYEQMLDKTDWLIILDQSLKNWDISLRAASEKLFYRENDYRSVGIYSSNCAKFENGYASLVKDLGNFIPKDNGLKHVISSVRNINDDGLLSIVSHKSNKIFDENHGKGSLGTALAAIHYYREHQNSLLVGLDTQLAQEWLSDRENGQLPDLVAINLNDDNTAEVDIIEVKTYCNNKNAFIINNDIIEGHAVDQASILEDLLKEMFSPTERITTVSRREILREQVFENLFHMDVEAAEKLAICEKLNLLFSGEFKVSITKNIAFVDFENPDSNFAVYKGCAEHSGKSYNLITIGSDEIQSILADSLLVDAPETSSAVCDDSQNSHNEIINEVPEKENTKKNSNEESSEGKNDVTKATTENEDMDNGSNTSLEGTTDHSQDNLERSPSVTFEKCAKLNKVLKDYGIKADPIDADMVQEAARFTRFPVKLKPGQTINALNRYKQDIGIQLEANGEILIDHIKGTSFVSVDIPFSGAGKSINLVDYLDVLDDKNGRLNVIAGQTPDGNFEVLDIASAPHMLIAGTTGSGKTIFLQSMIVSLLKQFSNEDLELLIVDPKQTDFIFFEGLPHLYGGEVVIDAEVALDKLQYLNDVEKVQRTELLRKSKSKDIDSYNEKNPNDKMKRIVVVIDEYSDLIQAAEMNGNRKDFEKNLLMLLQRVRNLGIHLIIATQRPSAQIVTGALKAVIPFRVSFRLPSHTDSQTILDMPGAENLLGKGDMLMVTDSDTKRMQGLYISEDELERFLEDIQ